MHEPVGSNLPEHPFEMLYCDDVPCRVNTFESGTKGKCPGCGIVGVKVQR